jgi:hypothetical protein
MAGRGALEHVASKGVLIMVARIKPEVFLHTLCTPERDPFDSEGVRLAVETARGLEGEGDFAGAVQWLRRAVREAEKQGNLVRTEDLARAAEELAEKAHLEEERSVAPLSAPISNAKADHSMQVVRSNLAGAPFAESPAPRSERSAALPAPPPTGSIPPLLAALISSMPPFERRASAEIPPPAATPSQHTPLPASPPPPPAASASAANDNIADSTPHSADERVSRVSAFRAAIPVSGQRISSFFIQRLASGQPAPAGMVEAMIVVTGESDAVVGFELSLDFAKGTASKA